MPYGWAEHPDMAEATAGQRPSATDRDPASWPSGHSSWLFDGRARFEGRIMPFLAEGARRGELVMCVSDDPRVGQWPSYLLDSGALVLASVREMYGDDYVVEPQAQRAALEQVLAQARGDGYAGVRVIADNTSLVTTDERIAAWLAWEHEAEALMAEQPVTGLCAFDRSRLDAPTVDQVLACHAHTILG